MTEGLLQRLNIASAFIPVDMAAAANDGDWVNMSLYDRCLCVLFKAAGTAGQDPVFTTRQATDNAGAGAKALNFTTIYEKVGTLTAVGVFTRVTQTAANTYTNLASAENAAIIAVEFKAAELDHSNAFNFLQMQIPDVGAAAQLGGALYLLYNARFAQQILDSALT
jgi:hypothetical protein